MRYIDPFDFLKFEAQSEEEYSAPLFAVAARNLLLKYDHSKDGQLLYEGKSVSRAEAEALIEGFKNPEIRGFHFRIKGLPGLQLFLAKQDESQIKKIGTHILLKDKAFNDFCSPYLAFSFDKILSKEIRLQHWAITKSVLDQLQLIRAQDLQEALAATVAFIERDIAEMQLLLEVETPAKVAAMQKANHLTATGYTFIVNVLPDAFKAIRTKYAVLLGQIASEIYHGNGDIQLALQLIIQAAALRTEPDIAENLRLTRNRIQKGNDSVFGNPVAEEYKQKLKWKKYAIIGSVLLSLLWGITKIAVRERKDQIEQIHLDKYFVPQDNHKEVSPYEDALSHNQRNGKVLCSRLNEVYQYRIPDNRTVLPRPKTGWEPYANVVNPEKWAQNSAKLALNFTNSTDKDLVMFIKASQDDELYTAKYIRAKETLQNVKAPAGQFELTIFNGENWIDSLTNYDGIKLGGFETKVNYVGEYPVEADVNTSPFLQIQLKAPQKRIPTFSFTNGRIKLDN